MGHMMGHNLNPAKDSRGSTGIGFTGALFLVFLTLKLTGYIDWSWWFVTAPLWFPLVAAAAFAATAFLIALLAVVVKR